MNNNIHILSTRPISQSLVQEAAIKGVTIDTVPFIDTEVVKNGELMAQIRELGGQQVVVIFTSMNAVEAVAGYLNEAQPGWKIFCIGETTYKLVKQNFTHSVIAGTADNAAALADVIVASKVKAAVFFCGDRSRAELPSILKGNHIVLKEIVVYTTIPVPQAVTKKYQGILFFSPSAAESFFSINNIDNDTIVFAIGNTTAEAVKKLTGNAVVVTNKPGKEMLVRQAVEYFR